MAFSWVESLVVKLDGYLVESMVVSSDALQVELRVA